MQYPGEIDVSIVVEGFTHGEGSSLERVSLALDAATRMVERLGRGEVLVADASADPALAELVRRTFPQARLIEAGGLGYDEAKMKTAREARGRFVLYLDGDCIPVAGWLDRHLEVLSNGAAATGGFTRYDGGFLGAVESIMDFGFLLPVGRRPLACYAFNNAGFHRDVLLAQPVPSGPMRCRCYAHAQLLLRKGTPVQMVPDARVRHERQPFCRERFRQGFDLVAACWTDAALREGTLLRLGVFAAPFFYARALLNDLRRLAAGWGDLGMHALQIPFAVVLLPIFRLVDLAGIVRALAPGGRAKAADLKG